jgi:hypothetical protein
MLGRVSSCYLGLVQVMSRYFVLGQVMSDYPG